MYGYNDYNGPLCHFVHDEGRYDKGEKQLDDEENDPLRPGLWMEGDSLAPPCGCSVSIIHEMLLLATVSDNDVLYDLGAGDGRVCLEAFSVCNCKHSIGVEIERSLVERFQVLIDQTLVATDQSTATSTITACSAASNGRVQPSAAVLAITRTSTVPRIIVLEDDLRNVLNCLVGKNPHKKIERNTTGAASRVAVELITQNSSHINSLLLDPTVITIYLLPEAIEEIEPLIIELLGQNKNKNLRIICNTWGLKTLDPFETKDVGGTKLFLYTSESLTSKKRSEDAK